MKRAQCIHFARAHRKSWRSGPRPAAGGGHEKAAGGRATRGREGQGAAQCFFGQTQAPAGLPQLLQTPAVAQTQALEALPQVLQTPVWQQEAGGVEPVV